MYARVRVHWYTAGAVKQMRVALYNSLVKEQRRQRYNICVPYQESCKQQELFRCQVQLRKWGWRTANGNRRVRHSSPNKGPRWICSHNKMNMNESVDRLKDK